MSNVFVVSAPSGAGKTTLNRRLLKENPEIQMSVSYTARSPREGEKDGIDYNFVTTEEFQKHIDADHMLEYANVFDVFYGTSIAEIERIHKENKSALLEIDVQGWEQAKSKLDGIAIFILPPTADALKERLEMRGTESKEIRFKRLMTAKSEIEKGFLYDYFIINDDIETAYQELYDIIIKGKKGKICNEEGRAHCQNLIDQFNKSSWQLNLCDELTDK